MSQSTADEIYRKTMKQATAAICQSAGFHAIDPEVLDLLIQFVTCYIIEIGLSTRKLTELSGRSTIIQNDAIIALTDLGVDIETLPKYFRQICSGGTIVVPSPKVIQAQTSVSALKVGASKPHPNHIPDFLPPFPDPHTYIRTDVCADPDANYQKVRELSAEQRRNTDIALKNLLLSTCERPISLFRDYEEKVRNEARRRIAAKNPPSDSQSISNCVETENAIVRRQIPPCFQLLSSKSDARSYLCAFPPDELEDQIEMTSILSENAYLREAKLPRESMNFV